MSFINRFDGDINVISRLLKKYRTEKKLSYEALSTKLELMGIIVHKQSIYDIEHNKRAVKDFELFGFARALDLDVNDLLQDIGKKIDD